MALDIDSLAKTVLPAGVARLYSPEALGSDICSDE
jgi:hypothetical protein